MEPWKLAVIAALGIVIVGFGIVSNGGNANPLNPPSNTVGVSPTPTSGPLPFVKYMGTTLPAYPNVKQWINAPGPVSISSLKGKPVLLEVFRIDCSHCNDAAPFMVALHARYAPRGVAFVGIQSPGDLVTPGNPETNWTSVQAWIKAQGYTWPVGFDANSAWFQGKFGPGELAKNLFYPTFILFDKNGNIVFAQSGHDNGKAVQLAAELEHIAPGQGGLTAQTKSLSQFLSSGLGVPANPTAQTSLSKVVSERLGAIK